MQTLHPLARQQKPSFPKINLNLQFGPWWQCRAKTTPRMSDLDSEGTLDSRLSDLLGKGAPWWKRDWVLAPNSSFKVLLPTVKGRKGKEAVWQAYWDWVVMVGTFYAAAVTPYNAAFASAQSGNVEVRVGAALLDVLFLAGPRLPPALFLQTSCPSLPDVALRFRTGLVDGAGREEREPKAIAKAYLRGWFWLDALTSFPYDLLELVIPVPCDSECRRGICEREGGGQLETVLLIKCVRILRLLRLFTVLERYGQYSALILALNMVIPVVITRKCPSRTHSLASR